MNISAPPTSLLPLASPTIFSISIGMRPAMYLNVVQQPAVYAGFGVVPRGAILTSVPNPPRFHMEIAIAFSLALSRFPDIIIPREQMCLRQGWKLVGRSSGTLRSAGS